VSQITTAPPASLLDEIRTAARAVLVDKLRFDAGAVDAALSGGADLSIPSRKALVVIARVQRHFGVPNQVKASDLRPEQVTSVRNVIDLLGRRLTPVVSR
jgi:hypothetical protein